VSAVVVDELWIIVVKASVSVAKVVVRDSRVLVTFK